MTIPLHQRFARRIAAPAIAGLLLALAVGAAAPVRAAPDGAPQPAYGRNTAAASTDQINGIALYSESYGSGQPLLLIHGNGGDISDMARQIAFFAPNYRVIAADSRGHGKSELGAGRLTYEQQCEDLNRLLELRGVSKAYVLGWSDGGILGLLLAIRHPDKVAKLAVMGANLRPDGAYPWAQQWVAGEVVKADAMIAAGNTARPWRTYRQQLDLLGKQPNIALAELNKIAAPTLVMAGDKDVIRAEHTLQMFEALPKAQLAIFPGATHMIPVEDAELFNKTVARFFSQPFTRPDTRDLFK